MNSEVERNNNFSIYNKRNFSTPSLSTKKYTKEVRSKKVGGDAHISYPDKKVEGGYVSSEDNDGSGSDDSVYNPKQSYDYKISDIPFANKHFNPEFIKSVDSLQFNHIGINEMYDLVGIYPRSNTLDPPTGQFRVHQQPQTSYPKTQDPGHKWTQTNRNSLYTSGTTMVNSTDIINQGYKQRSQTVYSPNLVKSFYSPKSQPRQDSHNYTSLNRSQSAYPNNFSTRNVPDFKTFSQNMRYDDQSSYHHTTLNQFIKNGDLAGTDYFDVLKNIGYLRNSGTYKSFDNTKTKQQKKPIPKQKRNTDNNVDPIDHRSGQIRTIQIGNKFVRKPKPEPSLQNDVEGYGNQNGSLRLERLTINTSRDSKLIVPEGIGSEKKKKVMRRSKSLKISQKRRPAINKKPEYVATPPRSGFLENQSPIKSTNYTLNQTTYINVENLISDIKSPLMFHEFKESLTESPKTVTVSSTKSTANIKFPIIFSAENINEQPNLPSPKHNGLVESKPNPDSTNLLTLTSLEDLSLPNELPAITANTENQHFDEFVHSTNHKKVSGNTIGTITRNIKQEQIPTSTKKDEDTNNNSLYFSTKNPTKIEEKEDDVEASDKVETNKQSIEKKGLNTTKSKQRADDDQGKSRSTTIVCSQNNTSTKQSYKDKNYMDSVEDSLKLYYFSSTKSLKDEKIKETNNVVECEKLDINKHNQVLNKENLEIVKQNESSINEETQKQESNIQEKSNPNQEFFTRDMLILCGQLEINLARETEKNNETKTNNSDTINDSVENTNQNMMDLDNKDIISYASSKITSPQKQLQLMFTKLVILVRQRIVQSKEISLKMGNVNINMENRFTDKEYFDSIVLVYEYFSVFHMKFVYPMLYENMKLFIEENDAEYFRNRIENKQKSNETNTLDIFKGQLSNDNKYMSKPTVTNSILQFSFEIDKHSLEFESLLVANYQTIQQLQEKTKKKSVGTANKLLNKIRNRSTKIIENYHQNTIFENLKDDSQSIDIWKCWITEEINNVLKKLTVLFSLLTNINDIKHRNVVHTICTKLFAAKDMLEKISPLFGKSDIIKYISERETTLVKVYECTRFVLDLMSGSEKLERLDEGKHRQEKNDIRSESLARQKKPETKYNVSQLVVDIREHIYKNI
ncbi:hypothetical protein BB559_007079 [Furculomyces boomerangus]|uniref:Uncharacterized protein n=2 Tax=Harpellales TaxID=61421 RepID=A0A2T9XZ24_9FUNG|nr:hypothetical protein BB559_007079 [Furculomyces boomerangus]PWA00247.1 hypothetical protein BB558_003704 [Smittium angustum]